MDEQPDERFGMSLPRAGYLSRLLRARRTAQWRESARKELFAQLNKFKADARQSPDLRQTLKAPKSFSAINRKPESDRLLELRETRCPAAPNRRLRRASASRGDSACCGWIGGDSAAAVWRRQGKVSP